VVDEISIDVPKTKEMVGILSNLNIDRSCLVAVANHDVNIYKSARNIQKVDVMALSDLNAGIICNKQKILFTKEAFANLIASKSA
jgi:large subunit ribosomal protein L4